MYHEKKTEVTSGNKAKLTVSFDSFNCTQVIFQAIMKLSPVTILTFSLISLLAMPLLLGFTINKGSRIPKRKISKTLPLLSELNQQGKIRQLQTLACLPRVK